MTPMTGMSFIGVDERAKKVRAELNRLHWEVEHAIDQGKARAAVSSDLAQAVGIMSNILMKLGQAMADEPPEALEEVFGDARARFADQVQFFTDMHKVAR